nr:hypothetical protein [Tanacetum cinerariifolium]
MLMIYKDEFMMKAQVHKSSAISDVQALPQKNIIDKITHVVPTDQNAEDEHVTLSNFIANLKLDIDENKTVQKQLKKANASLTQELKECKSTLAETSRTLGESNSIWDSGLIALQNKQSDLEKYMTFNSRTIHYDKLKRKLNETLGLLAQKDIDIKEGLKLKSYEISVVKEKHDELVKQSLLTKLHYEGLVKEKKGHRFASQVGVPHDLTKPVTPHSWPQVRKSSFVKPNDVNAPGPFGKSPKHVSLQSPRESVGLNDKVHN